MVPQSNLFRLFSEPILTVNRFTSYINNLHPLKYKNLYSIIEKIIDRAIPLWNKTLFPLQDKLHGKYRLCRIPYSTQEFEPDPDRMAPEDTPQQEEGEQEDAYWERRDQWARDIRRVVLPNPGEFKPPPPIDVSICKLIYCQGFHVEDLSDS